MDKKGGNSISIGGGKPTPTTSPENGQQQGLSTLLVMIAVLGIILLFCFLGAPGVRDLCKRTVCKFCFPRENEDIPNLPHEVESQDNEFDVVTTIRKSKEQANQTMDRQHRQ